MDTRERLLAAALELIEEVGEGSFSTRSACERAGVTAPTLYHHFGDVDGLVSAAVMRGFEQFLARKAKHALTDDAGQDLMAGWDDYVAFARERPRLYAAMTTRVLQGGRIPAAEAARAHLVGKLDRLATEGRLLTPVPSAADVLWATAHAAALLCVAAAPKSAEPIAIEALRRSAEAVIGPKHSKGKHR